MKKAVEQCMVDFGITESGGLGAGFIFPEDFVGFQGHFPGNKILPGICQIQCAIAMLEKWQGKRVILKEIIMAKFLSPVLPSEELICRGSNIEERDGAFILKASFSRDDKKVAEMKLKVQFKQDMK
jgi:3-hydroxyacyl-[acyl-carrier-protein] dehydratase